MISQFKTQPIQGNKENNNPQKGISILKNKFKDDCNLSGSDDEKAPNIEEVHTDSLRNKQKNSVSLYEDTSRNVNNNQNSNDNKQMIQQLQQNYQPYQQQLLQNQQVENNENQIQSPIQIIYNQKQNYVIPNYSNLVDNNNQLNNNYVSNQGKNDNKLQFQQQSIPQPQRTQDKSPQHKLHQQNVQHSFGSNNINTVSSIKGNNLENQFIQAQSSPISIQNQSDLKNQQQQQQQQFNVQPLQINNNQQNQVQSQQQIQSSDQIEIQMKLLQEQQLLELKQRQQLEQLKLQQQQVEQQQQILKKQQQMIQQSIDSKHQISNYDLQEQQKSLLNLLTTEQSNQQLQLNTQSNVSFNGSIQALQNQNQNQSQKQDQNKNNINNNNSGSKNHLQELQQANQQELQNLQKQQKEFIEKQQLLQQLLTKSPQTLLSSKSSSFITQNQGLSSNRYITPNKNGMNSNQTSSSKQISNFQNKINKGVNNENTVSKSTLRKQQYAKEKELNSIKECTFAPKTNTYGQGGNRSIQEFLDLQNEYLQYVNTKKEIQKQQIQQQENKDLTFKPKIDAKSNKISMSKSKSLKNNVNVHNRLYEKANEQQQKKLQKTQELQKQEKQQSFTPKIHKKSKSVIRSEKTDEMLYKDALRRENDRNEKKKQKKLSPSPYQNKQIKQQPVSDNKKVSQKSYQYIVQRFLKDLDDISILIQTEKNIQNKSQQSSQISTTTQNYFDLAELFEILIRMGFISFKNNIQSQKNHNTSQNLNQTLNKTKSQNSFASASQMQDQQKQQDMISNNEKQLIFLMWNILGGEQYQSIKKTNIAKFLLAVLNLDWEEYQNVDQDGNIFKGILPPTNNKENTSNQSIINQKFVNFNSEKLVYLFESGNISIGLFDELGYIFFNNEDKQYLRIIFEILYRNRLSYEQLKNQKQDYGIYDYPKISPYSQKLAEGFRQKKLEEASDLINNNQINMPNLREDGKITHQELLLLLNKQQELKQNQKQQEKQNNDMKECTFTPKLNRKTKSIVQNKSYKTFDTTTDKFTQNSKQIELYNLSKNKQNKSDITSDDLEYNKNIDNCTFTPNHKEPSPLQRLQNFKKKNLNNNRSLTPEQQKHINKNVERIRKASQEKTTTKKKLELRNYIQENNNKKQEQQYFKTQITPRHKTISRNLSTNSIVLNTSKNNVTVIENNNYDSLNNSHNLNISKISKNSKSNHVKQQSITDRGTVKSPFKKKQISKNNSFYNTQNISKINQQYENNFQQQNLNLLKRFKSNRSLSQLEYQSQQQNSQQQSQQQQQYDTQQSQFQNNYSYLQNNQFNNTTNISQISRNNTSNNLNNYSFNNSYSQKSLSPSKNLKVDEIIEDSKHSYNKSPHRQNITITQNSAITQLPNTGQNIQINSNFNNNSQFNNNDSLYKPYQTQEKSVSFHQEHEIKSLNNINNNQNTYNQLENSKSYGSLNKSRDSSSNGRIKGFLPEQNSYKMNNSVSQPYIKSEMTQNSYQSSNFQNYENNSVKKVDEVYQPYQSPSIQFQNSQNNNNSVSNKYNNNNSQGTITSKENYQFQSTQYVPYTQYNQLNFDQKNDITNNQNNQSPQPKDQSFKTQQEQSFQKLTVQGNNNNTIVTELQPEEEEDIVKQNKQVQNQDQGYQKYINNNQQLYGTNLQKQFDNSLQEQQYKNNNMNIDSIVLQSNDSQLQNNNNQRQSAYSQSSQGQEKSRYKRGISPYNNNNQNDLNKIQELYIQQQPQQQYQQQLENFQKQQQQNGTTNMKEIQVLFQQYLQQQLQEMKDSQEVKQKQILQQQQQQQQHQIQQQNQDSQFANNDQNHQLKSSLTNNQSVDSQSQLQSMRSDQPLLFVDVNIGGGQTQRITVNNGDNSQDLAEKFAQKHGLDDFSKEQFKLLLDQKIQGLVEKIENSDTSRGTNREN